MGGKDGSLSLAIHSTAPRAEWRRAHGRLVVHGVGECLGGAARPQNEFRLIGFDETRHQAFRQRRIDQRGGVTGRRRCKKADDRFAN